MSNNVPPVSLPDRAADAHKGNFGRVTLVGGSRGMAGSIAMSSIAALKTGSGLVSCGVPDRSLETVAGFHPAVMTIPMSDDGQGRFGDDAAFAITKQIRGVDAIGCGPGMTTKSGSVRLVERLLGVRGVPRVLDADALNILAILGWSTAAAFRPGDAVSQGPLVLTPHPGELSRLTGVSAGDRSGQVDAAIEISRQSGVVIVVKGGPTVVVGSGQTYTNATGNPGMATGGTGDVLTGVITSLLGQGMSAWDAARLGVWIHGRAGDRAAELHGAAGMTAMEVLDALPWAVRS